MEAPVVPPVDTKAQVVESRHVAADIAHLNQEVNAPQVHADPSKTVEDLVDEYNRI